MAWRSQKYCKCAFTFQIVHSVYESANLELGLGVHTIAGGMTFHI